MRAFLSHSSKDKAFVGAVATALGRALVVYDVFEFSTGDEFHEAIKRGLERAGLFVLFASKDSLSSTWVGVELGEARNALLANTIAQAVCYIIQDGVAITDLPGWMRGSLVTEQSNPKLVALDIRRLINERTSERRPNFFVGRSEKMDEALDQITDAGKPLIVYGLTGVGRKTFVAQVARNHMSYAKQLTFELKPGDELPELLLFVHNALGLLSGIDPHAFIADASARTTEELGASIRLLLSGLCRAGTLPVIVDLGALSSDDGRLLPAYEFLKDAISNDPECDLAIVSARRLRSGDGNPLRAIRLTELDLTSSQRLIRLLAGHHNIRLQRDELEALATYVAGYPPAAAFAIDEIKTYGVRHVIENQHAIVNFNSRIFMTQIVRDRALTSEMQEVLRLLSSYSPLPLPVIAEYVGLDASGMDEALTRLMDFAFVVPDGIHYRISAPLRDAAYRAFRGLEIDHRLVADLIEAYLEEEDDDEIRLSLSQALFRAARLAGKTPSDLALGLARDLISITEQSYYDEEYDKVIQFGREAIAARPTNVDIRRFLAQAFVRKEQFEQAEDQIQEILRLGAFKEAFYVKGFLERRRRHNREAIDAYKRSIEYGRGGVAVHRELATCYFEMGDIPNAEQEIRIAEKESPHNRFIVDLRCKIAQRQGDRLEVERCLRLLDRIDDSGFAFHRRSIYELSQGNTPEALRNAKLAVDNMFRPSYEILANLANCEIEAGNYDVAGAQLRELDKRFGNTHHDARTGLRCKLELRRGDIRTAEALWSQLKEKNLRVHLALRAGILNQKLGKGLASKEEQQELSALVDQLGKTDELDRTGIVEGWDE